MFVFSNLSQTTGVFNFGHNSLTVHLDTGRKQAFLVGLESIIFDEVGPNYGNLFRIDMKPKIGLSISINCGVLNFLVYIDGRFMI